MKREHMEADDIEKAERILEGFEGKSGVLVKVLHEIQEEFGYLPGDILSLVSKRLGIPLAQVYGVASFYKHFYFTPRGKNIIKVCVGTACHVRGAGAVLSEVEQTLGIKDGETAEDLSFSLDTVGCVGCCALAPVVVVNEEVRREMTPRKIKRVIEKLKAGEEDEEVE
jgi:NADH:ubiquinone oxidoreductase subunit E